MRMKNSGFISLNKLILNNLKYNSKIIKLCIKKQSWWITSHLCKLLMSSYPTDMRRGNITKIKNMALTNENEKLERDVEALV